MMSNHLSNGKINIAEIQESARNTLSALLEKCEGEKAIIWDESLAGPVGLITEYKLLKDHDVRKMYPLVPNGIVDVKVKHIIFISRASLSLMDLVADYIHALLCEKRLKNKGVYGNLTIEELPCALFPFDNDLLSMEVDTAFKELVLDNDPTCLYQVAQAIMTIQKHFGLIGKVAGKGAAAKTVWDLMSKLTREQTNLGERRCAAMVSQIDQLLLIDRSVDLLSPLATQLTYEGLIDELFSIHSTTAQFPADKFSKPEAESQKTPVSKMLTDEKKQIILNSGDDLYAEIRDKNFNAVGPALKRKAKYISAQVDERQGKSIEQMKRMVKFLPQVELGKKCLATHTTIAELIKEKTDNSDFLDLLQTEQELLSGVNTDKPHPFIEDCIAKKIPLVAVLRLVCLQSLTNSGLKPRVLEYYKREILQTYGFHHILTLSNLEKAKLLTIQQSNRPYTVLRKTFKLIIDDDNEVEPTDVAYVHSVYAPITARLTQHLAKPTGWRLIQDVLSLLPGPTVDGSQTVSTRMRRRDSRESLTSEAHSDQPRVILVFFIGGCTFAEVSALRFLSQQEDANVEFVIATTKLINGNSLIKTLMEPLGPDTQ